MEPPLTDVALPEGVGSELPDWPIWILDKDGMTGLTLNEGSLPPQPPAIPEAAIASLRSHVGQADGLSCRWHAEGAIRKCEIRRLGLE